MTARISVPISTKVIGNQIQRLRVMPAILSGPSEEAQEESRLFAKTCFAKQY